MNVPSRKCLATIAQLTLGLCVSLYSVAQTPAAAGQDDSASEQVALHAFAAIHPIDVHVHVFKTDPAFQQMLERLNLKVQDILVMDDTLPYRKQLQPQVNEGLALVRGGHGHVGLCTTFDPYKFDSPSFTADAMEQLR
jgi:hypothetical protein